MSTRSVPKPARKQAAVAPTVAVATVAAPAPASSDEMMTIAAARLLQPGQVCFVGIGTPSAAANLARLTHAPDIVLVYESGTIGVAPEVVPLSIGDGELAETATALVSLPEIFSYWLQAGRVDVGFLGAAQIDRFGNLNTTVVGGNGGRWAWAKRVRRCSSRSVRSSSSVGGASTSTSLATSSGQPVARRMWSISMPG